MAGKEKQMIRLTIPQSGIVAFTLAAAGLAGLILVKMGFAFAAWVG